MKTILTDQEKILIKDKIQEIEKQTSGEIKVIVAKSSPSFKYGSKNPVQQKALKLFKKHKLYNTVDHTGVLLFFSLEEKQFYIHADEGIYTQIGQQELNQFSQNLSEKMKAGKYYEGICDLLQSISIPLIAYFPVQPNDVNELSDDVIEEQ